LILARGIALVPLGNTLQNGLRALPSEGAG
jgi:hypothetical protein